LQRTSMRGLLSLFLIMQVLLCGGVAARGGIPWTMAAYAAPWNYSELARLGFDAVYRHADWTWEKMVPGWHEKNLGKASLQAQRYNITFVAGQYYQQPSWQYIDFNYSRAVDQYGHVETRTPSPVDENWWRYMMEEPAVFIANMSLYYPIWGIVWDMELYYHETFRPPDYTFDEAAIQAFARDTGRNIPRQRHDWLKAHGLLDEYLRWQEEKAYRLALQLSEKVHTINPNLTLGILYFEDAWFHWKILEGFMTPHAPVTGWNEQTYGGYKLGGPEGVDTYRERWVQHGLNGEFLPGISAIAPWLQLTSIEAALRDNGHLWIYQQSEDRPERKMELALVNRYFLFNRTGVDPLPAFDLSPGVYARPYLGPEGKVSCLLDTVEYGVPPPTGFAVITESPRIEYAGKNFTVKTLQGPNPYLKPDDFPCVVYGLEVDDLRRTYIRALIRETETMASLYLGLGLGEDPRLQEIQISVEAARRSFSDGRYGEAEARVLGARDEMYALCQEKIWPLVDAALQNPRNSPIPLQLLNVFSSAKRYIEKGEAMKGRAWLFEGLKQWSARVDEIFWHLAGLCVLAASIGIRRGRGEHSATSSRSPSAARCSGNSLQKRYHLRRSGRRLGHSLLPQAGREA